MITDERLEEAPDFWESGGSRIPGTDDTIMAATNGAALLKQHILDNPQLKNEDYDLDHINVLGAIGAFNINCISQEATNALPELIGNCQKGLTNRF
jgi:hypothetical protein